MSDLSDFLRKKKEQYQQEQVNWNNIKNDWIKQVEDFMQLIKKWVEKPRKEGLIDIVEKEIELSEERIGSYKVSSLELIVGTESIKVLPVGRFIIGASGRVDITSVFEKIIVLRHSEKGWIFRNELDKGNFKPLTEGSFTSLIKELL